MKRLYFFAIITLAAVSLFTAAGKASAYTNTTPIDSAYNSRIIDDSIFLNTNTMNAQDIQNFLNSKVPTCDTYHQGGLAEYPPPYICLKDYVDPTTGKTAAQLIYDESTSVGLNPQVVLVTLEKEQGLVTDTWPYPSQYKSAMGYGCPESQSVCDSQYYGFYNQVHLGVRLLRAGAARDCGDTSTLSNWYISPQWQQGNTVTIDGRSTYLSTCSTGSLYNYTPHRPDSAYIADSSGNYYYGNYNFVNYFTSWFGPTFGAKIIQAPNDSRLFLLDRNIKHYISGDAFAAWGFSSQPITQVSQDYFDSITTGANLTRYASSPGGAVYYIDNGHKHWVTGSVYLGVWNIPGSQIIQSNVMLDLLPEAEWAGRFAKSISDGSIWLLDNSNKYKLPTSDDQYHWGLTPNNYTYLSDAALASFVTGPNLGEDVTYGGKNYVVDQSSLIQVPDAQTAASWGISQFAAIDPIATTFLGTPRTATDFVQDPSSPAWYMLTAGTKRYIPSGLVATAWGYGTSQTMTFVSTSLLSKFTQSADLSIYIQEASSGKDYLMDGQKFYIPDAATFNAWLPANATLPQYDANSLLRFTESTASPIIQPQGSGNIYTLDHGQKIYILNGNILNAWGNPRLFPIQHQSYGLVASLPETTPASLSVTNGGVTYFLDNGYSHSVSSDIANSWGLNSSTPISAEALARFTASTSATPYISVNGSHYAMTGGKKYPLGSLQDAFAADQNATNLSRDYFPSSSKNATYIIQSTDNNDTRMWLASSGNKYYFDNFARLASYGFASRGIGVTYLDSPALAVLNTQAGQAPLCIQKSGSGVKYLNFGSALGFPDGTTLANYCPSISIVSASIYDSFALTGSASRVVKDDAGKIYFIENGTKRWITNPSTYNSQYKSYPLIYLYGTTLSLIPDGAPIN